MLFWRSDSTLTKLLDEEIKLARKYPQYIIKEEYLILLYNNIFWIENYPYGFGGDINGYIKKYEFLNRYVIAFDGVNDLNKENRPSFWVILKLKILLEDLETGRL